MNYYKIIYYSSIFTGIVGFILLLVGIFYIPNDLPKQTVALSQEEFNKDLNNYRINSLGFKLIMSGASIFIFSIAISLIVNFLNDENINLLPNNELKPKSILKNKITLSDTTEIKQSSINKQPNNSEISEKKAKLIKQWTGKTPEEIAKIREDFFHAKKHTNI